MNFSDERYVRLYVRDTITWKLLPWQAKVLIPIIMRKLDRAGMVDLQSDGWEGLAALTDMPLELFEVAMPALLGGKEPVFVVRGGVLVMVHFIEAQEAVMSNAARSRESRAAARDLKLRTDATDTKRVARATKRDAADEATSPTDTQTERHETLHDATKRVAPETPRVEAQRFATSSRAHASRSEPSQPSVNPPNPPQAGGAHFRSTEIPNPLTADELERRKQRAREQLAALESEDRHG